MNSILNQIQQAQRENQEDESSSLEEQDTKNHKNFVDRFDEKIKQ